MIRRPGRREPRRLGVVQPELRRHAKPASPHLWKATNDRCTRGPIEVADGRGRVPNNFAEISEDYALRFRQSFSRLNRFHFRTTRRDSPKPDELCCRTAFRILL